MIGPYVWSFAFFVLALKRGALKWLVGVGILLAFAGLMKRQAAVLFPLYALVLILNGKMSYPEGWLGFASRGRAFMALGLGLVIGFAPIMIWYGANGELFTFVEQYFFSKSGWKYVQGDLTAVERLERIGDGFRGLWKYLATPTLLASLTLFSRVRPTESLTVRSVLVGGYLAMGFLGATLGLRFFKSYYLQVLPPLILLAVHPLGLLGHGFITKKWSFSGRTGLRSLGAIVALSFVLSPALINDAYELSAIRKMRKNARDAASHRIGSYIYKHSQPTDRIWVWGRWAWPVYYYADRRAATHFPKSLGVFTTTLTNTWRRPTKNTEFDPKSPWKTLMTELQRDKPVFIVLSANEDYRRFKALKALLKRDYRPVKGLRLRGYAIHQLKDAGRNTPSK